jgi:hypothetical protein
MKVAKDTIQFLSSLPFLTRHNDGFIIFFDYTSMDGLRVVVAEVFGQVPTPRKHYEMFFQINVVISPHDVSAYTNRMPGNLPYRPWVVISTEEWIDYLRPEEQTEMLFNLDLIT